MADRLPFLHQDPYQTRRTPTGLNVPCDGPTTVYLDAQDDTRCSDCDGLLVPEDLP